MHSDKEIALAQLMFVREAQERAPIPTACYITELMIKTLKDEGVKEVKIENLDNVIDVDKLKELCGIN